MRFNPLPLLPGSCYPQPDELLSSWVSRLALNHGMAPRVLCQRLSELAKFEPPIIYWVNIDLDRYQLPELLNLLATHTATPLERVYDTTLWDYELFANKALPKARSSVYTWWLPSKVKYETGIGPSFCANCLRKDGAHPYFRKQWCFSHTVACLDCGVLLTNGCPSCRSGIDYLKLNWKSSIGASLTALALNIATCRSCGFNLAQTPLQSASLAVLELQQRLHQIWREGLTAAGRRNTLLSFNWLESMIRALLILNFGVVPAEPPACFLIPNSGDEQARDGFESLSADMRARLLYQAVVFLGEGGEEFSDIYAQFTHRYNYIWMYTNWFYEPRMYGFLKSRLKYMPPDWMDNWSALAANE